MNAARAAQPVVVTRAEAQDGPLSRELRELGLQVLRWPVVRAGVPDLAALRRALETVESFGWIVFASRQAVAAVVDALRAAGCRPAPASSKLARALDLLDAGARSEER